GVVDDEVVAGRVVLDGIGMVGRRNTADLGVGIADGDVGAAGAEAVGVVAQQHAQGSVVAAVGIGVDGGVGVAAGGQADGSVGDVQRIALGVFFDDVAVNLGIFNGDVVGVHQQVAGDVPAVDDLAVGTGFVVAAVGG